MAAAEPLDARLIDEALSVLAEEGLEHLTLRRLARRAGVSHGAPLRHYRSFSDLLSEVAARGFQSLSEMVSAAADEGDGVDPMARLRAVGRAYVHAAVDTPDLFNLMFRTDDLDTDNASFIRESSAAFEQLVGHVRAAQATGFEPERPTRLLAGVVWAAFHGLALLWSQGAFPGAVGDDASLDDAVDTALDLVLQRATGGSP